MALVTYNGITLPYSNITDFKQEAMYDDKGRTDWYLTKFDITVNCTINKNYLSQLVSGLLAASDFADPNNVSSAAAIMATIRSSLLRPRRVLSVIFNDTELIPRVTANDGTVDSANGPQPQHCNIIQLTNELFIVSYRIVAHYWEKTTFRGFSEDPVTLNSPGGPILYNRWTDQVDIDLCQYSRRIRDGKFVIRSDNNTGQIIDRFRSQMAVLGVPPGFLREQSRYRVSPDGLSMEYTLADREVYKTPPEPAYKAEGEYIQSIEGRGVIYHGQARVKLWGAKDTPQMTLINAAVIICAAKLRLVGVDRSVGGVQTNAFAIVDRFDLMVDMYENIVECIVKAQLQANTTPAGTGRLQSIAGAFFGKNIAFTPVPRVGKVGSPYRDYGTAGLLLQAAKYFDPSLNTNRVDTKTGNLNNGLAPGEAGQRRE